MGALVFQNHAATDHDVAPALVELDDLEVIGLAQQFVDVGYPAEGDLTARQERVHSHQIDDDAALDLLDQGPFDRLIGFVSLANLFPHPHEIGLLLREHHGPVLILQALEKHLHLVPFLQGFSIFEFFERDRPL